MKGTTSAVVLTTLLVAALGLTSCSPALSPECLVFDAGKASDAVMVTGEFGGIVIVDLPAGVTTDSLERSVVINGTGQVPASGQTIDVRVSFFAGATGAEIYSLSTTFTTNDATLPSGVRAGIECLPVGSRTVTVLPASDLYTASQLAQVNLQPQDLVVMVADILGLDEVPKVYPWNTGLPTVEFEADGAPTISLEGASRPAGIYVAVVKQGDGAVVGATDTVGVNYSGVMWSSGQVFDGNYGSDPAQFSLGNVIEGFRLGLVGQKVGSELLVSIPAKFAYGESTSSSSNQLAGQDLLFLIDIVSASPTPAP
ncbi:MAG: FKBP-type peptidyl-prolyl cis-trans isomerase [Aurantimicrobium sp.]|nr:FKBP-type peptidyl-prolyl cis-trans isomerase [Aurantimicrobium sp.]